ncbi:uncharacterized protein LOC135709168 isoform X2 [Ochlerotatus camptorhynchus]|uniref:uncharacterized protein LOC135709168 isoform X2 n=1 Tax=Ochlerotatus camptorhynchus TaxID=644619 RepID=UPI0031D2A0E4
MTSSEHQEEIPKRLLNQLLYVEKIVIGRKNSVLAVITTDRQLLEVKEHSIVTAIDLTSLVVAGNREPPVVSSIFGTLSPPTPIDDAAKEDRKINLTMFRSNDGIDRKTFYLLEIERSLVVIERKTCPCVKFVHYQTFEGFIKLEITESDDRPGFPVVKIYVEQQTDPIVTDFQAYRLEASAASVNSFTCFYEVLKTLKERTNQRRAELAAVRTVSGELFEQLNKRLKQVPSLLRTENPDEKQPLVKYGDVWTKVHNELLVIGVPVFNCTYKRRLTLTNLKLKLFNNSGVQLQQLVYSYKYYQLNDDDFNFKTPEQIMEAEDAISEFPLFQQEWEQPPVNTLHSEQTAILVATLQLSTLDPLQLSTLYELFVNYNVATVEQDSCDRLHLFLGSVEVKRTDLYKSNLAVAFNGRDTYKDLLTVTATSEFLAFELVFQKTPNRGFDRFCIETLKFRSVNLASCTTDIQKRCRQNNEIR